MHAFRSFAAFRAFCLLLAALACPGICPLRAHCVATASLPPLALFGVNSTGAYPLANVSPTGMIERWHTVMARHAADDAFAPGNKAMPAPMRKQWNTLAERYPAMSPEERLRAVNAFFNRIPGVSDERNYGQEEYWAYPAQFIRKNGGDCEDYALAKYLALRRLGWPEEDLLLALVKDTRRKTDHAVLAVRLDGRIFILDNLSRPRDLIMPQDKYGKTYSPLLVINARTVWNFGLPVKRAPKQAARETQ